MKLPLRQMTEADLPGVDALREVSSRSVDRLPL